MALKLNHTSSYVTLATNLIVVFQALSLWIAPEKTDASAIYTMSVFILFEFFALHSGGMLGGVMLLTHNKLKVILLLVLIPIYLLFGVLFYNISEGNFIFYSYLFIIANRIASPFLIPAAQRNKALTLSLMRSFGGVFCFLVAIFSVLLNEQSVPVLGLNEGFLNSINYAQLSENGIVSGISPAPAMLMTVVYFSLLTGLEILFMRYGAKIAERMV